MEGMTDDAGPDDANEQALVQQDQDAEHNSEDKEENDGSETINGDFQQNGNFSGSGDMNQMQMMMAMQNGMGPNSFGGFPMMSMSPPIAHATNNTELYFLNPD